MLEKYPEANIGKDGRQGVALLWLVARFLQSVRCCGFYAWVWQIGGNCPVLFTVTSGL